MSTPRRRARTNAERPGLVLGGAAIVLGLIAVGVFVTYRAPAHGLPGQQFRGLSVRLPEVGNVRPRNEVRVAGRRVGQVLDVRLQDQRPVLDLQLIDSIGAVPVDSKVVVRAKGLLGARYIELTPGRSTETVPDGGTIAMTGNESITIDVPTALSTFDGRTRRGLRGVLDGFGTGLAGRAPGLHATLEAAPDLADQNLRVADAILARTGAAGRLAPSLDAGVRAFDQAREDMVASFAPARRTFAAIAAARDGVAGTLENAPAALDSTTRATTRSRRIVVGLEALAVAINGTLPPAPDALRRATAMLRDAGAPLQRATGLLNAVRATVPPALTFTEALRPLLAPLSDAFGSLTPLVRVLGRYGCDIDGFASNWRSMLGFGRPNNDGKKHDIFRSQLNTLRLEAIVAPDDLIAGSGVGHPAPGPRANPYPEPCTDPTSHITK